MHLERAWSALQKRLKQVAEGDAVWDPVRNVVDEELVALGLIDQSGDLTEPGNDIFMTRFVKADDDGAALALGRALQNNQVVTAFCGRLWAEGEVPVAGAVSLLKRITGSKDEASAKRWIAMMNAGGLVAYNRNRAKMRVLYNPSELMPAEEEAQRERAKGHVIGPETPFGNLLALRELVRSARGTIRWYEQHMPGKVLEVLFREVARGSVTAIRILSGPANVNQELKDEFKRFDTEMKSQRDIETEWRVLSKKEAFKHHGRVFLADGIARNLPPLNTILAGSTDEILESSVSSDDFDEWWGQGTDLAAVAVVETHTGPGGR
jgi:hypothetical protein